MKFTNGYWLTKPEYRMAFAVDPYRVEKKGETLQVIATTKPARHDRGAILNIPTFTVRLSSPMENVITVEITHFKGVCKKEPHFELYPQPVTPKMDENDTCWALESGDLRAEISKGDWQLSFKAGETLTASGYHGVAYAIPQAGGEPYMIDSLDLAVGEMVYGLGERFGPYVKNGQTVDMWNADGGTSSELAYKNIPFYMTSRGYGVFVDDPGDVSFEVQSEKVERVQFSVKGETLRYHVLYGKTPKGVLTLYTALTGRPALPPAWSFGLWLSTSFTTDYSEKTTSSFIDGMAQRGIPLSVFHFDCYWMKGLRWCNFEWDDDTFPDPKEMLTRYKGKGLHLCCWINPYIAQDSEMFEEGMTKGYFIRKDNGDVWQTDMWQSGMAVIDVTNPDARAWYCAGLERLLDMGIDCIKTDFGERIPVRGIRYADGSDPLRMHNYFTFLYNKMVFELLEKHRGKGEAILFARSATAGSQQFPCHWGGDCSANFPSMAETLRGGLSMAHSGFAFWSHDISGFEQTASPAVYKRWAQFGLLSSHSRLHGSGSYRVPWLFDDESSDVVRKFTRLKCRLMPYLFAKAVEAHETGVPMMRPMMLEFPGDQTALTCDRQYMLGDKLLVAPVFSAHDVTYYLPEGEWINILDGHHLLGEKWVSESYDFLFMPLCVKKGTVLPMGAVDDRPDYDYSDGLSLHVYGMEDGDSQTVCVHDLKGHIQNTYVVTKQVGTITVSTDSQKPYTVVEY